MIALWDTTATDVVEALAAGRQSAAGASGLALNLVVVVDEKGEREVEAALTLAVQQHPCRLLIVVRRDPDQSQPRLDAEVVVGGRLGPCEAVVMRVYGPLVAHAESVVMPLLAPDVPVVTCWFRDPPPRAAVDPLGAVADRRITYAAQAADPVGVLRQRAADYNPGDTDLSWTRITNWRSLIASAFDTATAPAKSVTIAASAADPSAALLAGWLGTRLEVTPQLENVEIARDSEHLPGVKSVTITLRDEHRISVTRDQDGHTVLRRTGFPDRVQTLNGRQLGELLAEELRHLEPDRPYQTALTSCVETFGLCDAEVGASQSAEEKATGT